jgi:hypothetical protein
MRRYFLQISRAPLYLSVFSFVKTYSPTYFSNGSLLSTNALPAIMNFQIHLYVPKARSTKEKRKTSLRGMIYDELISRTWSQSNRVRRAMIYASKLRLSSLSVTPKEESTFTRDARGVFRGIRRASAQSRALPSFAVAKKWKTKSTAMHAALHCATLFYPVYPACRGSKLRLPIFFGGEARVTRA